MCIYDIMHAYILSNPLHLNPTSLLCLQFCVTLTPRWPHLPRLSSFPLHPTLFSHTGPIPGPNGDDDKKYALAPENPSDLQVTMPLLIFHPSLHIVPHTPLYSISTLPSLYELPPTSLTAVFPASTKRFYSMQIATFRHIPPPITVIKTWLSSNIQINILFRQFLIV